jgi:hypothetical protein
MKRRFMDKLNRLETIIEDTQLPGEWKEVKIVCPTCKKNGEKTPDEFVYLYDDQKTCYCCQCSKEFEVLDLIDQAEMKANFQRDSLQERLDEMVTDDPKTVSEMADRLLRCDDCDGRNGCHYSTCKRTPKTPTKSENYIEAGCPHGWYYLSNCPTCKPKSAYEHKYGTEQTNFTFNNCTHRPQHIIAGENWGVWAGKKEDCRSYAQDYDVILNLTFTSIKEPHVIPIPELAQYEEYNCQYKEIQLDWPDYGVINLPREFWVKLLTYLEENEKKMLVMCTGGHGRTGTALAVMMTMALEYTPEMAINWIHRHYCKEAIETSGQKEYIYRMAKEGIEEIEEIEVKSKGAGVGQ